MILWPFRKLYLQTDMSVDEAMLMLSKNIGPDRFSVLSNIAAATTSKYIGRVEENRFTIYRNVGKRPVTIQGLVYSQQDSTIIKIRFGSLQIALIYFMAFFMAGTLSWESLKGSTGFYPLLLLIVPVVLVLLFIRIYQYELEIGEEFLIKTLKAKRIEKKEVLK